MNPQLWWYVARATGITAWVLVTASVLWGVGLSARFTKRPKPAWVLDLHRYLGGLAVAFTAVHLVGLVLDSYVEFGATDLLVPFASSWKPTAVAWGVVAMYLLAAVEATSLMMKRLPRRAWRAVHLTSYGLFALVTVHALAAGTDTQSPAVHWAALGSVALVVFLTLIRVLAPKRAALAAARAARAARDTGRARPLAKAA